MDFWWHVFQVDSVPELLGHIVETHAVFKINYADLFDHRFILIELDEDICRAKSTVYVSELHHDLEEVADLSDELLNDHGVLLEDAVKFTMFDRLVVTHFLDGVEAVSEGFPTRTHHKPRIILNFHLLIQSLNVSQSYHVLGFSTELLFEVKRSVMAENCLIESHFLVDQVLGIKWETRYLLERAFLAIVFRKPYDKIVSFLENTDLFEIFRAPVSEQFLFSLGETPVFVAGSLSLCFG